MGVRLDDGHLQGCSQPSLRMCARRLPHDGLSPKSHARSTMPKTPPREGHGDCPSAASRLDAVLVRSKPKFLLRTCSVSAKISSDDTRPFRITLRVIMMICKSNHNDA